ncbi:hypothetical protein BDW22DRAFT_1167627 [Trametopsis cervina]|nr:hypothetical protein BDW22DRAFT_1167627 [Trametopsis cervina]
MRPKLSAPVAQVTLDQILAGQTCDPISLPDFEAFLIHKQRSVETLRFVVWFHSYSKRFAELPLHLQLLSPPVRKPPARGDQSSARLVRLPSKASTAVSAEAEVDGVLSRVSSTRNNTPSRQPFRLECDSIAHTFLIPPEDPFAAPSAELLTLNLNASLLTVALENLAHTTHPSVFEPAYERSYDMLLNASLPYFLADAETNTNSEKTVYWWTVGILTFLAGWAVAIGCLFIEQHQHAGRVDARKREWRLFAVPFLTVGGMQMYSAYRGFCSQVWSRGGTQLRPWELVVPPPASCSPRPRLDKFALEDLERAGTEDDHGSDKPSGRRARDSIINIRRQDSEEDITGQYSKASLEHDNGTPYNGPITLPSFSTVVNNYDASEQDLDLKSHGVAPSPSPAPSSANARTPTSATHLFKFRPTESTGTYTNGGSPKTSKQPQVQTDTHAYPPSPDAVSASPYTSTAVDQLSTPSQSSSSLPTHARIFGPERPILDPRIRAAHKRVLRDMLMAGFVWGSVWTAVVLCIPWA